MYIPPMRILTNKDIFLEEYSSKEAKEIYQKTNFDGSVAYAVENEDSITLFVDGRYYFQAQKEVKSFVNVKLCLQGAFNGLLEFLKDCSEEIIFVDFSRISLEEAQMIQKIIPIKHFKDFTLEDFVPLNQTVSFFNKDKEVTIERPHFISHGPMIAWILNIRCFFPGSYKSHPQGKLFVLNNNETLFFTPYPEKFNHFVKSFPLTEYKKRLREIKENIFFDPRFISYEDFLLLSSVKPTYSLQKEQNIKSEKEIQAIKDTFLIHCSILKKAKDSLDEKFSEKEFINTFKSYFDQYKVQDFSFTPICALNENTPIIHYKKFNEQVQIPQVFLVDTGIYLESGYASDLTRTFFYRPKESQKEEYTRVLKALILIESRIYKEAPIGEILDQESKKITNYPHGLGHGVGLEVHEPGVWLSHRGKEPLPENSVFSIEPGFYNESYGMRLENCAALRKNEKGFFFEILNFYPYEEEMILTDMLSTQEKTYLENYLKKCK